LEQTDRLNIDTDENRNRCVSKIKKTDVGRYVNIIVKRAISLSYNKSHVSLDKIIGQRKHVFS
jgi:hypothetical protein